MISFVWSSDDPISTGTGGSENYTVGQVRELQRRGIASQIVTLGFGKEDGRKEFPDIKFVAAPSPEFISTLDGVVIFVSEPLGVPTKNQSYVVLHCPPFRAIRGRPRAFYVSGTQDKQIIVPSKFAAQAWGEYLGRCPSEMHIAYPFAENCFAEYPAASKTPSDKVRVLFAGRLSPDKGIYTLLAALHLDTLSKDQYTFMVTTAWNNTVTGKVIEKMLRVHPRVKVIPARKSPEDMAALLSEVDVLVMPSHSKLWPEPFGILSVEAQHMGCRVVASKLGGLPETDCGGLHLVEPDNPLALARGIRRAGLLGRLNPIERRQARRKFTVAESVDSLLEAINYPVDHKRTHSLRIPPEHINGTGRTSTISKS